jgi:hypothetical protein
VVIEQLSHTLCHWNQSFNTSDWMLKHNAHKHKKFLAGSIDEEEKVLNRNCQSSKFPTSVPGQKFLI